MKNIKAVVLDVDGVLTDGTFWWGPDRQEWKRFSFRDVMGISLAKKAGIRFAIVSGEASPLIDRFAEKMSIVDVYQGCRDKADALSDFARKSGIALSDICFFGDDVNDLPAMAIAGLSAAPADAHRSVRETVSVCTSCAGGRGAVREFLDSLLSVR